MKIEISIDRRSIDAVLRRLDREAAPAALDAAAAGVRAALLDHFRTRQSEPRRDGFTPTGFWYAANGNSVAERVREATVSGNTATVTIDSPPLAHKLAGGTITPKGGRRYLALPATDAANLFPGMPRDNPSLRPKPFGHAPHPDGGDRPAILDQSGSPLYWLARKAVTPRDPRALPPDRDLARAALEAAEDALATLLRTP